MRAERSETNSRHAARRVSEVKLRHHFHPALLTIFLFEDVLLYSGELQRIEIRLQIVGFAITQILLNKLHAIRLVMPN